MRWSSSLSLQLRSSGGVSFCLGPFLLAAWGVVACCPRLPSDTATVPDTAAVPDATSPSEEETEQAQLTKCAPPSTSAQSAGTLSVPTTEESNETVQEDSPWANPRFEITHFDCTSSWEHKEGESLRSERGGGGPAGAMWNWYGAGLRCSVTVDANCRGGALVSLRVGQHYEEGQMLSVGPLDPGGPTTTTAHFEIAAPAWERELRSAQSRLFESLLLVAWVEARCVAPVGFEPEPISLTDSFVGRFSGGE